MPVDEMKMDYGITEASGVYTVAMHYADPN